MKFILKPTWKTYTIVSICILYFSFALFNGFEKEYFHIQRDNVFEEKVKIVPVLKDSIKTLIIEKDSLIEHIDTLIANSKKKKEYEKSPPPPPVKHPPTDGEFKF